MGAITTVEPPESGGLALRYAALMQSLRDAIDARIRSRLDGDERAIARGAAFCAWSYATAAMRVRIARAEDTALPHWVLHDLRRTVRTGMSKIAVAPHIAERVLNHVKSGVEAIYDRHRYEGEIKSALAIWAEHVLATVEGRHGNVTSLRRA